MIKFNVEIDQEVKRDSIALFKSIKKSIMPDKQDDGMIHEMLEEQHAYINKLEEKLNSLNEKRGIPPLK